MALAEIPWHDRTQLLLASRRVDDEITEIVTSQSRWFIDLAKKRFQRCALTVDRWRAIKFGSWTEFTSASIVDGRYLVVEPRHGPPVRADLER